MCKCLVISIICLHQCARALGMCCYVSAAEEGEVRTASSQWLSPSWHSEVSKSCKGLQGNIGTSGMSLTASSFSLPVGTSTKYISGKLWVGVWDIKSYVSSLTIVVLAVCCHQLSVFLIPHYIFFLFFASTSPPCPPRTWSSHWPFWRVCSCLPTPTERELCPHPNPAVQAFMALHCRPGRCLSPSVLHLNWVCCSTCEWSKQNSSASVGQESKVFIVIVTMWLFSVFSLNF